MRNGTEVAANNNQKPKIAIFHYSGPPNTSGVDIVVRDQARLFRLHGYKVEIVAGLAKQFRKDIPVHIIQRISPIHPLVLSTLKELEEGRVSSDFKKYGKIFFDTFFLKNLRQKKISQLSKGRFYQSRQQRVFIFCHE